MNNYWRCPCEERYEHGQSRQLRVHDDGQGISGSLFDSPKEIHYDSVDVEENLYLTIFRRRPYPQQDIRIAVLDVRGLDDEDIVGNAFEAISEWEAQNLPDGSGTGEDA
ncbi:hypothetical protein [Alicyclobacillus macrosporangiidus]|uniref:hypothetical protein n=1 Tax=Alicyclobacillus macrosporangiidus TaxID=392015 RepID=UPI001113E55F|nr:hypothetical protein [Alicyclobacillus macrosporangiidus]